MDAATLTLHEAIIRHLDGIVAAYKKYIKAQAQKDPPS